MTERWFCVQGQSGRLYAITPSRIYLLDGLGKVVASTCHQRDYAGHIREPVPGPNDEADIIRFERELAVAARHAANDNPPLADLLWSIAMMLQFREEEVWTWTWWRMESQNHEPLKPHGSISNFAVRDNERKFFDGTVADIFARIPDLSVTPASEGVINNGRYFDNMTANTTVTGHIRITGTTGGVNQFWTETYDEWTARGAPARP